MTCQKLWVRCLLKCSTPLVRQNEATRHNIVSKIHWKSAAMPSVNYQQKPHFASPLYISNKLCGYFISVLWFILPLLSRTCLPPFYIHKVTPIHQRSEQNWYNCMLMVSSYGGNAAYLYIIFYRVLGCKASDWEVLRRVEPPLYCYFSQFHPDPWFWYLLGS